MKIKIVTSVIFTVALFTFIIFQSFATTEDSSSESALWINGYVHKYMQCPQSIVQPGAYYVITNITRNKVVGSGTTGSDGYFFSTNTQGTQGGDQISISATSQYKVGCVRFTMPSGDAHVNVCLNRKGNACTDEE